MSRVFKHVLLLGSWLLVAHGCSTLSPTVPTYTTASTVRAQLPREGQALGRAYSAALEPSIVRGPLMIFIHRDESGAANLVRVAGLGRQDVECRRATKLILQFLESRDVRGLVSFGIAQFEPGADKQRFRTRVEGLLVKLESVLDDSHFFIWEIPADATDTLGEDLSPEPSGRAVRVGVRNAAIQGPAHVPLRAIERRCKKGAGCTKSIGFELTKAELRLGDEVFAALLGDYQRLFDLQGAGHDDTALATDWINDPSIRERYSSRVGEDHKWAYELRAERYTSGVPQIRRSNSVLRGMIDKLRIVMSVNHYHMVMYASFSQEIEQRNVSALREVGVLQRAVAYNNWCVKRLKDGRNCEPSTHAGMTRSKSYFKARAITRDPPEGLVEAFAGILATGHSPPGSIASVEVLGSPPGEAGLAWMRELRTSVVDGVLRGWPLPTIDLGLANIVDRYMIEEMPIVWSGIIKKIEREHHVRLRAHEQDLGALGSPNVFFRVEERGEDSYWVTPYFHVAGRYAEIWDFDTGLVTVEVQQEGY